MATVINSVSPQCHFVRNVSGNARTD